jgi:hypothetical protein
MNLLPALALATLLSDDVCSARLDKLLVLYREYGLPISAPDAPLVRRAGDGWAYLDFPVSGDEETQLKKAGWSVTIVRPDPVALGNGVQYGRLDFAIRCHERGWHALARAAFRKWLTQSTYLPAERQLAWDAWYYWHQQLSRHGAPLGAVAKYMKRALAHISFASESKVALLRSLDLALVPARSAPGSDDALIDALVEEPHTWVRSAPAYRALARRGFDAVPALIAHLGDDRATRSLLGGGLVSCDGACFVPVKDVVYWLLCALAGRELEPSKDLAARTLAAGRWFADAQKMGEEQYVVAHVGRGQFVGLGEDVLLPLLVEKYPLRLPEVYRRFLDTEGRSELDNPYAKALVDVPIPLADKLKVLEYAAAHPERRHRWVGLHYLRQLDPRRANELLVAALDRMETDAAPDETRLAQIVPGSADPKVWAALARAAKRVAPGTRVQLLDELGATEPKDPVCRRLQFGFVAAHLTDTDERNGRNGEIEVRDHAAALLAALLDLEAQVSRRGEDPPKGQERRNRTAAQWAQLREQVRIALEHDARGAKP